MNIADQIRDRLQGLAPIDLQVEDESSQHVGHAGAAGGGGHYRLTIVSPRFSGQNAVVRHRLVYESLGDLMKTQIHALAITALSPEEL